MFVHQGCGNCQAQPGAAPGGFGGKKGITQASQMLWRNPYALVCDFQDQAMILRSTVCRHAHPTSRVRQGLQGVHNEIDHHVLKLLGIASHWR
jgi:hypothetical protein